MSERPAKISLKWASMSISEEMAFLGKLKELNQIISCWVEWIGLFAFLVMMSITCVDVVGTKLFRVPVFGSIDIVALAQLLAVSSAASMALIMGRHVQVNFFIILLPKRLRLIIECLVHFLGLGLFLLIVWRLFACGYSFQKGGDATATAYIPLFPLVYGAAIAFIPVCSVYLQLSIRSFLKVLKNEP